MEKILQSPDLTWELLYQMNVTDIFTLCSTTKELQNFCQSEKIRKLIIEKISAYFNPYWIKDVDDAEMALLFYQFEVDILFSYIEESHDRRLLLANCMLNGFYKPFLAQMSDEKKSFLSNLVDESEKAEGKLFKELRSKVNKYIESAEGRQKFFTLLTPAQLKKIAQHHDRFHY